MQNWQKCVCLYTVMLSLVFCLFGCVSNDVKKAQEFMDAGMYAQAMELLSKRIGEKPSDADAHFLMGICNIHTNNDRAANDRFASAVRLKSDYGFKIGAEYKKVGNEVLTNGDMSRALNLYLQAVHYQPDLKDEIGAELLTEGKSLFERGPHKMAGTRFMVANGIKPELGADIAEYYYQAGIKSDVPMDLKTLCFDNTVKYDKKSEYIEAHTQHHYELSKAAKTTEAAIKELKIANKFGEKFKPELKAKQQQFEHEKFMVVVKKYEAMWGPAKKISLTKKGEWKYACTINKRGKIAYLSLHTFKKRGNDKISIWKAAIVENYGYRMRDSQKFTVELSMNEKPTDVYFWENKI